MKILNRHGGFCHHENALWVGGNRRIFDMALLSMAVPEISFKMSFENHTIMHYVVSVNGCFTIIL